MAMTPEKIQRYRLCDAGVNGAWMESNDGFDGPDSEAYILESDHLRHLKLAQIVALERVASMSVPLIHPDDPTRYIVSGVQKAVLLDEIAALRKELEG